MNGSTTFKAALLSFWESEDPEGSRALETVLIRDFNVRLLPKEVRRSREKGVTAKVSSPGASCSLVVEVTYPRPLTEPPPSFEEIMNSLGARINGVAAEWRDCKLFVEALRLKREALALRKAVGR